MDNIKIYVAAHQRFVPPSDMDTTLFTPIHCGKALYNPSLDHGKTGSKSILPELGDDTGDNISDFNNHYSELTGMYWIWKNDTTSDIVGLNHYRRLFSEDDDDTLLISRETIMSNLKEYDFLVSCSEKSDDDYCNEEFSVYNEYGKYHNIQDMNNALAVCSKLFPEVFPTFYYEITHCAAMNYCNLLICRKDLFDEYCSFLFPLLFRVERMTDFKNEFYDEYQMRMCGFLSERLFRPWLIYKGYTFKNQPIL